MTPWRAQVVVAKDPSKGHKKRLCIDYSQTVNLYTELDAYGHVFLLCTQCWHFDFLHY